MLVSIIAAMDRNRLIGSNNALPWRLPADLAHFKKLTLGKPVIMGRKTHDSIGRPLPGRLNIVLSRNAGASVDGVRIATRLEQALEIARQQPDAEEAMIIGGSDVYAQALPLADRLYITEVHAAFEGDAWFPAFDRSVWSVREKARHTSDERNGFEYSFITYERRS